MIDLDEDLTLTIQLCGALEYDADRISLITNISADVILPQLNTKKGKIWDEYHKGKILHEYKCETKLMELAHDGDIKAMEKLKQNQREREKLNRKK